MKNHIAAQAITLVASLADELTCTESELERLQGELEEEKSRAHELYIDYVARGAQCAKLQKENDNLRRNNTFLLSLLNDPTISAKLFAYMTGKGAAPFHMGERIAVIKHVRELTGCGLKEACDLVESYSFLHPLTAEDSVPSH